MYTNYTSKIRYKYIEYKILEFYKLLPANLLYFPLDVEKIIKILPKCKLWTYQHYAETQNETINYVITMAQSKSGCAQYDAETDRWLIMYNNPYNKTYIFGRQLFTIAHELGHIFLNHRDIIANNMVAEKNIIKVEDKYIEKEADYFAANVSSPLPLFDSLNIKSSVDIKEIFGLSEQAAKVQFQNYLYWKTYHYITSIDNDIKHIFKNFIINYNSYKNHSI